MATVLLKEIPILPSLFKLDIVISNHIWAVSKMAHDRYGASEEWYRENLENDCCCSINTTLDSHLKGCLRIVVFLKRKKLDVLSHELIHAMWYLAKHIGYEMSFESQEWQAILYEYMLREAMKSDYKKIDINQ